VTRSAFLCLAVLILSSCSTPTTTVEPAPTSLAVVEHALQGGTLVSGVVTDASSGRPIAFATVDWAGLAETWGDRGDGVLTGTDGQYQINIRPRAAEGEVMMRAAKPEFADDVRVVTLGVQEQATVNFKLTP
jgi:hypothetical protein